ncbi:MAG: N-acetylglucosamine-6-phosphate deacetylase, partial [Lachnospiraceae bacterium]|nr:N-acetylglucosamine-6-phosphate deacetylase [Lachnospiraceae bacterium]
MIIRNGLVYGPDGSFERRDVRIAGDRFADPALADRDEETINAEGMYLIPGLTDIHLHGADGRDFSEGTEDAFRTIAAYEEAHGITQICPATMTLPKEELVRIAGAAAEYVKKQNSAVEKPDAGEPGESAAVENTVEGESGGAAIVGIYMEGPFLSKVKCGVQNTSYMADPNVDFFREIREASGGLVKILGIAPELPGAIEFIREVKEEVILSLAHSDASYEEALAGFRAGVRQVTHLFNVMRPITPKDPGPVPAGADAGGIYAELVCDGVRVHPAAVRMAFELYGEDHILFVSDALPAAGMTSGSYTLGGEKFKVIEGRPVRRDGTPGTPSRNLMENLVTAVKTLDIPLEAAVRACAVTPAKVLGIYDSYGSIEAGKTASLAGLDAELRLSMVFNRGSRIV